MIPESPEVRREGWMRGEWWALRDKLPSSQWLHGKLPQTMTDWYMWAIFAMAGAELAWSMYLKLSKRKEDSK